MYYVRFLRLTIILLFVIKYSYSQNDSVSVELRIQLDSTTASIYNNAMDLYYQKNYPLAIKKLKLVIDKYSSYEPAYEALAQSLIYNGDNHAALKYLNTLISITKKNDDTSILSEAYNMRGNTLFNMGDTINAIKDFDSSLIINPNDIYTYLNFGQYYGSKKNYNKAFDNIDKAISLDSTIYEGYVLKGILYWQLYDYPDAEQALNKAIALDSTNTDAYYYRAMTMYFQKRYRKAINDMRRVQIYNLPEGSLGPKEYFYYLGASYYKLQEFDTAIKYLSLVLKYDKEEPSTYYFLGNCYLNISQYNQALKYLSKYNKLSPSDVDGYSLMGLTYIELEQYNKAIDILNKALKMDSADYFLQYSYGRLYFKQNHYKEALETFNKSIALMNDTINHNKVGGPYYYRAQVYFKLNNIDSGCSDLRSAKELGYSSDEIDKLLKQYCTH